MNKKTILIGALLAVSLFTGCKQLGVNPTPPTKFESQIFEVKTNYVPVEVVTPSGTVTNEVPIYVYHQKPGTTKTVSAVGAIGDLVSPGVGGALSTVAMAGLSLWAWFRGSKFRNVSITIAQEVETLREFLKRLPQGVKYDQALVSFLQRHQMETGTAKEVLKIIQEEVDDLQAKEAVKQIIDGMDAAARV